MALDIGIGLSGDRCISEIPIQSPLSFLRYEDGRKISRLWLPKNIKNNKGKQIQQRILFKWNIVMILNFSVSDVIHVAQLH